MTRHWSPAFIAAAIVAILAALIVRALRGETGRLPDGRTVNLAHRGDSDSFPENTLAAFEAGVSAGADGLELDVHMTRDGYIVVIHDDTVDRTTNGAGLVRDMTIIGLRDLDAGYWFSPENGYPHRGRGLYASTLSEVLNRFPQAFVNLEIKEARPGIEAVVLDVIRSAGAQDRVVVAAANHRIMRRFRKVSGGRVSTSASQLEIRVFYLFSRLRLERLLRPSYDALQVPPRYGSVTVVTPRFVEAAHRLGVRVDVWTINNPVEMRRLLEFGADTIMTDRPGELSKVLAGS
ncbi:MAG: glycerophosphodiester phosphodiesterase [Rubrobacteraceae bacterium]